MQPTPGTGTETETGIDADTNVDTEPRRQTRPRRNDRYEVIYAKCLIEDGLEAGLAHCDAVRIAVSIFREIDVVARDSEFNLLSPDALEDIRSYCRAILRSGSTFSAFEIATRAVYAWREATTELEKLHAEWRRERVNVRRRLRLRQVRRDSVAKSGEVGDVRKSGDAVGGAPVLAPMPEPISAITYPDGDLLSSLQVGFLFDGDFPVDGDDFALDNTEFSDNDSEDV